MAAPAAVLPSVNVVPACVSCHFQVYPFHRPVQNKCSELHADKRKYMQHRQRILHAKSTVHSHFTNESQRSKEESYLISSFMDGQDVDNLIDDVITKINRLFKIYTQDDRPNYKLQSLNATKRKEELNRIINENDSLYHRLMNQKSCYPNKQMKKDWKYHQDLFARISKYPNTGKKHGKVNKKLTLPPIQTRSAEINTSCKPNNCIGNRLVKKP